MNNPYSLENKTIVVTGASSGIGKATAIAASHMGANIILVGRDRGRLQETFGQMKDNARNSIEIFDMNDIDVIPAWLKQLAEQNGEPINGIAHFAGIHETIPLRILQRHQMDNIFNLNLYSALALLRGSTNKKVFSPGGSIVLASSVVGQVGQAGVVTYSASKGALLAVVKSAAMELAKTKIRVNAVVPGMVRTQMLTDLFEEIPAEQQEKIAGYHPLGFGEPEDVANAVVYLLSDAARWVTGTGLVVDGGYTCH